MNAVSSRHLTKSYGKARGIEDVNLDVASGEFFGFIGPNGAGKSTTIRTLLGFIHPTRGEARVLGLDTVKNNRQILECVGYLPAEVVFHPHMRVRDVLKLSADLRSRDCSQAAKRLCDRLELDVSRRVDELSFGNRKKAAIVCALQHEPDLLILDEPTSGLDPLMQRVFFDILRERNAKGTTIFLSSHILTEIQRYCTRAAVIREGRIVACDGVDSLAKVTAKVVSFRGEAELQAVAGIRSLQSTADGVSFLYQGDIQTLLTVLAAGRISDLSITEPDLETAFVHFYEEGGLQTCV